MEDSREDSVASLIDACGSPYGPPLAIAAGHLVFGDRQAAVLGLRFLVYSME